MPELLPEVQALTVGENGEAVLVLFIPASLVHFAGHFPGLPLLPGVVQIDWAVRLGCRYLPLTGEFLSLENLKFHSIIQPDAQVRLTLNWHAATGCLSFSYASSDGGHLHSSGRLAFGARTEGGK